MHMRFSIIIPVYNAEKYLRECLDSVLAQTYSDWEAICVDDGSTDVSGAILDEYAARDSRFKVIHQENGGEAVARNTGLVNATGEWVTWLDADDFYAADRLEEAVRIAEMENPDIIRFRGYSGVLGETGFGVDRRLDYSYCVKKGREAQEWAWNGIVPAGMVWMWVAKRELLEGLSFVPEMRVKTDCIYSCELAARIVSGVQSEYEAYFYRYIEGSAIHSKRRTEDSVRVFEAIKGLIEKRNTSCKKISLDSLEAKRLRMTSECEVIDWVLANPANEGVGRIRVNYLELKKAGVFAAKSIQQHRYRIPMWWFDKTGQVWPIKLIGSLEKVSARIKRLCK